MGHTTNTPGPPLPRTKAPPAAEPTGSVGKPTCHSFGPGSGGSGTFLAPETSCAAQHDLELRFVRPRRFFFLSRLLSLVLLELRTAWSIGSRPLLHCSCPWRRPSLPSWSSTIECSRFSFSLAAKGGNRRLAYECLLTCFHDTLKLRVLRAAARPGLARLFLI